MLHIISRSSLTTAIFERISSTDTLLFIEDAVLMLLKQGFLFKTLQNLVKTPTLYVLEDDIAVRGIALNELVTNIKPVNYSQFVQLTIEHEKICSWA